MDKREAEKIILETEKKYADRFAEIDEIALNNQEKVLDAFISRHISAGHFAPSTGYGYDDTGREKLSELFADIMHTESAIASPHFASGTHTITCALFGILRPGDTALSLSGLPYDTLRSVILGKGNGSLADFGIGFECANTNNGAFDKADIEKRLNGGKYALIYIQRSPGYERRKAYSIDELENIISFVRRFTTAPVIVDNCYGEFVETREPTDVGADLVMGSLIKNPGGTIAPTGGYIAGKEELTRKAGMRLTAPGVGTEIGSYEHSYRTFFQGLFLAPHVVAEARKGGLLFAGALESLGISVFPSADDPTGDIVRVADFGDKEKMIAFCRAVQAASPIDAFARPDPWAMPGYDDEVIMASGSFIQGSSIELSADAPVRPPYSLYIQGGATFEHAKIALKRCLETLR